MKSHVADLGAWIASRPRIPDGARRAAKFQILDMIASVHASARGTVVDPIRAVRSFAGTGRATFLATGERFAPGDAALANAALSMAEDYDDIVWMGHTCHSAVFASLAIAEHEGSSGSAFVDAVVIANEIGGRIGASCLLGPLNGQMWTFIHLAGAAAATAHLLKLDATQSAHAIAIALAQPNFALQPGFLQPTSKLLAASTPTQTGMQAAYFAREGMTGHPQILEDRRGFWSRFSFLPLPEMLGDLGETWVTETLAFKTYPGCHYFQTALTAIDRIRARTPFEARDVASIRIDATKLACEATRFAKEYVAGTGVSPVAINFDVALSAAVLIHAGRLSPVELDEAYLHANGAAIADLASRIEVHHDPALTAEVIASARALPAGRRAIRAIRAIDLVRLGQRYRQEYRSSLASPSDVVKLARALRSKLRAPTPHAGSAVPLAFPGRVAITLRDGARHEERVDVPVGSFYADGALTEITRKVMRETAPTIGEDGARALIASALSDETTVADLVARARVR